MALFLSSDGKEFWGEFEVNKTRHRVPLHVKVRGTPPPGGNLKLAGDPAFEQSRGAAHAAVAKAKELIKSPEEAKAFAERVCEMAGVKKDRPVILTANLEELWRKKLRKKPVTPKHVKTCASAFASFMAFLAEKHPEIIEARDVSARIAHEFMTRVSDRGVSGKTFDNIRGTLLSAFGAARTAGGVEDNPFASVPPRKIQSRHRVPYTDQELQQILAAAKSDPLIGSLVIVASTTGMRRENCVKLRWSSIDLEAGEIALRAFKTGEEIWFPVLPPLQDLLEQTPKISEYCFPAAVSIFGKNPDSLHDGLLRLLKRAGINIDTPATPKEERDIRLRQAPQHGFHVFKTTFITLSLNCGIPIEMVRKIVGNSAVDAARESYYRPSKEAIKEQFRSKLPGFLSGKERETQADWPAEALRILESVDESNWRDNTARAVAALKKCVGRLSPRER